MDDKCAGYLRKPHRAVPVLFLKFPDGTEKGFCQVCANRWLLSDEEFPPSSASEKSRLAENGKSP